VEIESQTDRKGERQMIVKILDKNNYVYLEGIRVYRKTLKREELDKFMEGSLELIDDDISNDRFLRILLFNCNKESECVVTNLTTFLMNDNGKTIEKLN